MIRYRHGNEKKYDSSRNKIQNSSETQDWNLRWAINAYLIGIKRTDKGNKISVMRKMR